MKKLFDNFTWCRFAWLVIAAWFIGMLLGASVAHIAIVLDKAKQTECAWGFEACPHVVTDVLDAHRIVLNNEVTVRLAEVIPIHAGECLYEDARAETLRLVEGKQVRVWEAKRQDPASKEILGYVMIDSGQPDKDDLFLNEELLVGGFAHYGTVYGNNEYADVLLAAENYAFHAGKGMWSTACAYLDEADQINW